MTTNSKNARIAGLLYLLLILLAPFRMVYIPGQLFVTGNAAATASNIASHAFLFRSGMASDMLTGAISLFLTLALVHLFKDVNKTLTVLMLFLGFMDTPLYFVTVLNDGAALILVQGADFLSSFNQAQRDSLMQLFLRMHGQMITYAEVFWGLWLFPLAALVIRSGFIPRFIGVWLVINGLAYLALSFTGVLAPQYADMISNLAVPCQFGEIAFMLWILIMGARPKAAAVVKNLQAA